MPCRCCLIIDKHSAVYVFRNVEMHETRVCIYYMPRQQKKIELTIYRITFDETRGLA